MVSAKDFFPFIQKNGFKSINNMLEQGVDIKTVSQMLGHTDAGFTMNTYMHVTTEMQKNAVNAMSELINNSGKKSDKIIKIGA